MKTKFVAALLAGSALAVSTPAFAQDPAAAPQSAPEPTEPDQSDATADAAIANAEQVDDAAAKIQLLQAQVDALQSSIEQLKGQLVKATPTWKGGPEFGDKDAGFTFKPKGLIQWDAGFVGFPNGDEVRGSLGGLNYQNLGWNSRGRRLTIGADGTLPGGFRYSAEFNLANAAVDYEDIFIAYDFKKAPVTAQIGHIYPFSSLETMTSSKYTSFLERASITDAFNYNRRLGIAFTANDKKNDSWIIQAGLFNEPVNDNNVFTHTGWQASIRGVYSPTLGSTRLHIGANFQHRDNRREALGAQYRSRPYTQLTGERFVDTGTIASKGDDVAGLELAAIHKSLHFAAEAQKVWVRDAFNSTEGGIINTDPNDNDTTTGTFYNGNPSFWGGYAELGYYLTGETRGYKGGSFNRTKVLHPFNEGGWGAFQINGRVEYLELRDRVDTGSASISNPFYVNGGRQIGYLASLIWNPTDYVRFMGQYSHIDVTGGPRAGAIDPTSLKPVNKRKFNSDLFAVRAQVDF
jgi:phosphate-selective porin OprO/OprP